MALWSSNATFCLQLTVHQAWKVEIKKHFDICHLFLVDICICIGSYDIQSLLRVASLLVFCALSLVRRCELLNLPEYYISLDTEIMSMLLMHNSAAKHRSNLQICRLIYSISKTMSQHIERRCSSLRTSEKATVDKTKWHYCWPQVISLCCSAGVITETVMGCMSRENPSSVSICAHSENHWA